MTRRKDSELLQEAMDRIVDLDHFCTDVFAKDADGDEVSSVSSNACRWCAAGSLARTCGVFASSMSDYLGDLINREPVFGPLYHRLEVAAKALYGFPEPDIPDINDSGVSIETEPMEWSYLPGHDAILSIYRRAIEDAKAEGN